jgi:hypothetical protein
LAELRPIDRRRGDRRDGQAAEHRESIGGERVATETKAAPLAFLCLKKKQGGTLRMDWSEAGRAIAWIVVTIFGACLISTVCGLHADWVDNNVGRKGALYYACKAVGRLAGRFRE